MESSVHSRSVPTTWSALEDFSLAQFAQSLALKPDCWNYGFLWFSFRGFSLDAFSADSMWQ